MANTNSDYPTGGNRYADATTVDHLISLTKLANRYSRALMDISLIDGSDALEDLRIARKIARQALFPDGAIDDRDSRSENPNAEQSTGRGT